MGYEFGDPVEVMVDGEWRHGVYLESGADPLRLWCSRLTASSEPGDRANCDWFKASDIRPRAVAPRSGWRLPEPGDVVCYKNSIHHGQFDVEAIHWENPRQLACRTDEGDPLRISMYDVELVRLHDALADAPAKEAEPASQEGFAPGRPVCKRDNPNRKGWIAERMDVPNDAWTINWHDGTQTWCYEGSLRLLADSEAAPGMDEKADRARRLHVRNGLCLALQLLEWPEASEEQRAAALALIRAAIKED